MTSLYDRAVSTSVGATVVMVVLALAVGVVLGVLTKAALWLYEFVVDLVWHWLPEQFGLAGDTFLFMALVLVVGGILVGIGQLLLGYLPRPLEDTVQEVSEGRGVDYRSIPSVLANTLPALGAGAPLGPESGLIAVIGGIYFWLKERMDDSATRAFRSLTGNEEGEVSRPWRLAPSLIAGLTVIAVFRTLSDGADLSAVPAVGDEGAVGVLLLALATGVLAGLVGIVARRLESGARALRLFDRIPLLAAPLGGLLVAVLALPSTLVLFSGAEEMSALFAGDADPLELLYAGGAKLAAMVVVIAAGWKGGTVFPLMFIGAALAVGVAGIAGLDPAVMYAAAVAGVVAGHLRSLALGVVVALLVVPGSLLLVLIVGAAGGTVALRFVGGQRGPLRERVASGRSD